MSFSDINCRLKCAPSRALEEIQLSRVSVCVSLYMQIRLSLMPLRTASVVIKWEQKNYFSFQFSFNLRGISRERARMKGKFLPSSFISSLSIYGNDLDSNKYEKMSWLDKLGMTKVSYSTSKLRCIITLKIIRFEYKF